MPRPGKGASVAINTMDYGATPGDNLDEVSAIMYFKNAPDFVLTTFQRIDAGEATGDPATIEKIRKLQFRM
jgi:hypothetical protein